MVLPSSNHTGLDSMGVCKNRRSLLSIVFSCLILKVRGLVMQVVAYQQSALKLYANKLLYGHHLVSKVFFKLLCKRRVRLLSIGYVFPKLSLLLRIYLAAFAHFTQLIFVHAYCHTI